MTPLEHLMEGRRKVSGQERPAARRPRRPGFHWSDLWRAPLHDLPVRDEILYQYLPLSEDSRVLEVGPGSGFTAFRLAREVRQLMLVELAPRVVTQLSDELKYLANVRCVCADVSQPGLEEKIDERFDAVYGLDVLEYVIDPAACLRNLAKVLRPGGQLLLTYPNVAPPVGDGVTYFLQLKEIEELLVQAGFQRWTVFAVRMRATAAGLFRTLHEWPLLIYRRLRKGQPDGLPQNYESTWAFQYRRQLHRYRLGLHVFWTALGWAMRLGGDVFEAEPATEEILGRQLVILAWR